MKRFVTSLAMLAMLAWLGCEQLESPQSPSLDRQQAKPNTLSDSRTAAMAKLKAQIETGKAKIEERATALKTKAEVLKKQHPMAKSSAVAGAKITVPDDYPTIQEAVDNAAPGTKILVKDGTYTEQVTVYTNNLTIVSAHKGQAHVIGGFGFSGVTKGSLEGFDITGGVFLEGCTKVEIKENEVKGTIDTEGFGIILFASLDCVVKDNKVHDNTGTFLFVPSGISIYFGGKHLVKGNICQTNPIGILVLGGLDVFGGPSPGKNSITFNECSGNIGGIVLFASQENTIGDNKCNFNEFAGIYLSECDRNKIGSNNQAKNNGDIGIFLDDTSDNNSVTKNTAKNNVTCDAVDLGTGNTFTKNSFGLFNCP